ncbi:methyl farnesoate epoxidase-like [Phymastichus coffea]|uniref:methyl farnesoate epoxidase-like n=1 Tax=Phymastichus coffea TaxID=108790 RepID=UPI00273BC141|nr:methyl farnesoate epoxidase-like [Phymastichus coffea]
MTTLLLLLLCALLGLLACRACWRGCAKPRNFPPGPAWLPLLGCLAAFHRVHRRRGYMYLAFEELSRRYGPVLGLKMGRQRLVVVSGHELVREVLLRDEFTGRPNGFFFRARSFGKELGVLFSDGPTWSQHRRFAVRHLRAFGFGQASMARQLEREAGCLVDWLRRRAAAGPVPVQRAFDVAVLNSLWWMFAGHRFEHADRTLHDILRVVHEIFRLSDTVGGLMSHMPFLRHLAPGLTGYNEFMANMRRLWVFLEREIAEHEANMSGQPPRDLIDAFLVEIQRRGRSEPDSIFDRDNLLILCLDLFLAGSKTTSDTLVNVFAFLALQPHWLRELQDQLDSVVGRHRPPSLADLPALPKLEAFLAEAQRTLVMAPLGIPHRAVADVTLAGYSIPKDTVVLLNYHSVNMDEAHFAEPQEFRPQRFIDDSGKFRAIGAAMPFGIGKRRCLGEGLARSSLFLFFSYVIHYFDLKPSEAHGKPDLNGYDGFVISLKPYYLELTPRTDIASAFCD